jgi:uncharacterized protein with GYD domain
LTGLADGADGEGFDGPSVDLTREGGTVPKFLVHANYTPTGLQGVLKGGGSARRDAIDKMVADAGGHMEAFYFAFGDDDAYVLVDLPDNSTAAGVSMMVTASGAAVSHVTVLLTPEEVDQATQLSVEYRPPGN